MAQNITTKIHARAIKAAVDLSRYEQHLQLKIRKQLRVLQRDLLAELADASPKTDFNRARLEGFLKRVSSVIKRGFYTIAGEHNLEMIQLAAKQSEVHTGIVNGAVGVDIMSANFSSAQLKTLVGDVLIQGAPSVEWWARAAKSTTEKFSDAIRQGVLRGETIDQMTAKVKDIGGVIPTVTRQVDALVRTSVQTVANDVRQEVFRENDDVVQGIQWVSTLDDRTTQECMALDGLEWDMDLNPIGHDKEYPGPIAHWGCRSTQIPVLKPWGELIKDKSLGKELDAYERDNPGLRASMDGQVSAKITYEDWLSSQSKVVQEDILGPGRYELWKEGKLSLRDMTDMTGRPLSLKEL